MSRQSGPSCRSRLWLAGCLTILIFAANAHAQSADVSITLEVSQVTDLRPGDVMSVAVHVRNHGPDASSQLFVAAGQASLEVFLYDLINSTPSCGAIGQMDVDPPAYSFHWTISELPAGASITCAARLQVIRVPPSYDSVLYAGADPNPLSPDPDESNNVASVPLTFAKPVRPHAIPVDSSWTLGVVIVGVLLGVIRVMGR